MGILMEMFGGGLSEAGLGDDGQGDHDVGPPGPGDDLPGERQFVLASLHGETQRMGLRRLAALIDGSSQLDDDLSQDPGYVAASNSREWLRTLPDGEHDFGDTRITAFPA